METKDYKIALHDRLLSTGRAIFHEEIRTDFARIARVTSDTGICALDTLRAAPLELLNSWARLLPEIGLLLGNVDGDRKSPLLKSQVREEYLESAAQAAQKRMLEKTSLFYRKKYSAKTRSDLRKLIDERFRSIGLRLETFDPTTRTAERQIGPFLIRTRIWITGKRLDYGHQVILNGKELKAKMSFMGWLGLTTTEWDLVEGSDIEATADTLLEFVRIFLAEVEKCCRI